jgi:hypothetical protein
VLISSGSDHRRGNNSAGQLNLPAAPAGQIYTAIAISGTFSLALTSAGQVNGAGFNDAGQLNLPAPTTGQAYTAIAAGFQHSLAISSPIAAPPGPCPGSACINPGMFGSS